MERIAQLVEVRKRVDGRWVRRFQNYLANGSIVYRGNSFPYLPFLYAGATRNKAGDNMESAIVFAVNRLVTTSLVEHVEDRYMYSISTVSMAEDNKPARTLQTDLWLAASMAYNDTEVELLLSSALDAVGANTPNRILTTDLVGRLPVSGSVQTG
jgi:phage-related protein